MTKPFIKKAKRNLPKDFVERTQSCSSILKGFFLPILDIILETVIFRHLAPPFYNCSLISRTSPMKTFDLDDVFDYPLINSSKGTFAGIDIKASSHHTDLDPIITQIQRS